MEVRVLGCGDAFGSGGRFNTCFHITTPATRFLIDCGASALIAMRRFGVEPNAIQTVFLTHLHGDHFGGLPFLILDAQLVSRRTAPLTIVGPSTLRERLAALMEAMFPGSSTVERRFDLRLIELGPEMPTEVDGVTVTAFPVRHPSGAPSYALRLACEGRTLCYTGDTEWVDALYPAGREVDLLIAEAYTAERPVRYHLDWATLRKHLPAMAAKSVLLTHMSPDMLDRIPEGCTAAEDGGVILL
ncbi:MBL fold metallo-hydrolase [Methylobacterium nodulans]|uniref:Beta-lactamase domain protein n=1 Tax=Methylobacterium nodulans (strain LMG 21967 / CNCM I-2342 / ORS 2060) TaxID=460265 RepID=B8IV88_METNO|nr:MBL fold metallo-hydrolase [Methylobacterium nodulans]ACL60939.1 beta-lactamase domain protein [Methylobacterium nodulans ORS 2060]